MRRILLLVSVVFSISVWSETKYDLLNDLLDGKYKASVMNSEEIDSVLNGVQKSRYKLCKENENIIFRRSKEFDWYLWDTEKEKKLVIGRGREAVMSPNGKYVAYVKNNNIWIYKVDFGTQVAVTNDGDTIYNGISDWLYEEEFGKTRMFEFSPDSKQLAFVRLNEKEVSSYTWLEYINDTAELGCHLYPIQKSVCYPKAGENNPIASVHVYDILSKDIQTMDINDMWGDYIPKIWWRTLPGHDPETGAEIVMQEVVVARLNRDQNKLNVMACDPKTTISRELYSEFSDKYYIDYSLLNQWRWLSDGRFIVLSERDEWRRLYLYSAEGFELKGLTSKTSDVTEVIAVDEKNEYVYYQYAPSAQTRQCAMISWKRGNSSMLTQYDGVHRIYVSNDFTRIIDCFSSISVPNRYTIYSNQNGKLKMLNVIKHNDNLARKCVEIGLAVPEFFRFETERHDRLYGWKLYPKNFDQRKKYPAVVIQYNGPGSQKVINRWEKTFEQYLSQHGYVVVCVDTRGTDCRGRMFRNKSYMKLGLCEAEDLVSVGQYLQSLSYVDPDRICLAGWSYGGYTTLMTMTHKETPYKCGIAIAPVTSWRLYDSGYTERFMRRPQVNEKGYNESDAILRAKDLKGHLLLVHGMADDNVHYQNTILFSEALVAADKQFEMQIYPDDNHFLKKRNNYIHLHRRIMQFLRSNL